MGERGGRMRREICLGERVLAYEFTRKRVKNCNLRIRGDGSVVVSAPLRMPMGLIEDFLRRKQDFIWHAVEKAETELRAKANDDAIPYLGGMLQLHFEEGERYAARRTEDGLHLTLQNAAEASCRRKAMERWEKEECFKLMAAALERIYPAFAPFGVPKPTLRFRSMRSRWGSCIPAKRVVTMNTRLLAYPMDCIEYILIHELCHFLRADHSAEFYAWMDRFLPNWREMREKLNQSK